jgi:hypothetical protein
MPSKVMKRPGVFTLRTIVAGGRVPHENPENADNKDEVATSLR